MQDLQFLAYTQATIIALNSNSPTKVYDLACPIYLFGQRRGIFIHSIPYACFNIIRSIFALNIHVKLLVASATNCTPVNYIYSQAFASKRTMFIIPAIAYPIITRLIFKYGFKLFCPLIHLTMLLEKLQLTFMLFLLKSFNI